MCRWEFQGVWGTLGSAQPPNHHPVREALWESGGSGTLPSSFPLLLLLLSRFSRVRLCATP